jgi:hypothetical protein
MPIRPVCTGCAAPHQSGNDFHGQARLARAHRMYAWRTRLHLRTGYRQRDHRPGTDARCPYRAICRQGPCRHKGGCAAATPRYQLNRLPENIGPRDILLRGRISAGLPTRSAGSHCIGQETASSYFSPPALSCMSSSGHANIVRILPPAVPVPQLGIRNPLHRASALRILRLKRSLQLRAMRHGRATCSMRYCSSGKGQLCHGFD